MTGHGDGPHTGMAMAPRATGPQLAAVGVLSVLALGAGVLLALVGAGAQIRDRAIDVALGLWFALTLASVAYVALDSFTRTPQPMIMKWGWLLMTLYTGPVGAALYVLSCQEPAAGAHERFVEPLWKQGVGSTIHCVAGDATGIIASAVITSAFGLPMWLDVILEYLAGFAFGLLIFQALFMRGMLGGSYLLAVRKSFLPEWLSMNGVMAGMIPVMVLLMLADMRAMDPSSPRFWAIMSLATLAGAFVAYPVNLWLVQAGYKHGMATERRAADVPPGGRLETSTAGPALQQPVLAPEHGGHGAHHGR
ncbi:MAG: DUF4396 domain-containing protein [Isosphaeraceae bacterium]